MNTGDTNPFAGKPMGTPDQQAAILRALINTQRQDAQVMAALIQKVNVIERTLISYGKQSKETFGDVAKDVNRLNAEIDAVRSIIQDGLG